MTLSLFESVSIFIIPCKFYFWIVLIVSPPSWFKFWAVNCYYSAYCIWKKWSRLNVSSSLSMLPPLYKSISEIYALFFVSEKDQLKLKSKFFYKKLMTMQKRRNLIIQLWIWYTQLVIMSMLLYAPCYLSSSFC